jgi:hypothetical protein
MPEESTRAIAQPFVKDIISPPIELEFQAKRQWCHDALQDGQVTAWIDDFASLNEWLLDHCDSTAIVNSIALAPRRYAFVVKNDAESRPLAANLSQAIITLETTTAWKELQRRSFGWGDSCPTTASTATDTTPVSVEHMGGLFIITGAITAMAALSGCGEAASKALRRSGETQAWESTDDVAHGRTEGEMLRALINKIDKLNSEVDSGLRRAPTLTNMPSKLDLTTPSKGSPPAGRGTWWRRSPSGAKATFEDENVQPPGCNVNET